MCARRRSNFLLAAKRKSPKRRRPPVCVPRSPCRRTGATCDARFWGGADELAAFFELRSDSIGKLEHEACVSFGTHAHPRSCASRRSQQGWGAGTTRLLLRSCAWGRGRARCALPTKLARSPWRAERSEGPQAERSNGPYGARSHPLLTVPRSAGPGVSACRRTRASSSGSPKLFDRSCLAEAAQGVLRRHPRTEHRRLPPAPDRAMGDTGSGVAFLWGTFLWRLKERYLGRRAETRLPPSTTARSNHSQQNPRGKPPIIPP